MQKIRKWLGCGKWDMFGALDTSKLRAKMAKSHSDLREDPQPHVCGQHWLRGRQWRGWGMICSEDIIQLSWPWTFLWENFLSEFLPKECFNYPVCGLGANHRLLPMLGMLSRGYYFKTKLWKHKGWLAFSTTGMSRKEGRKRKEWWCFSECVSFLVPTECFCICPWRHLRWRRAQSTVSNSWINKRSKTTQGIQLCVWQGQKRRVQVQVMGVWASASYLGCPFAS